MAIDEQDREWVEAIVGKAASETLMSAKKCAQEIIKETMTLHVTTCPIGQKVQAGKRLVIGIAVGIILAAGGGGAGVATIVVKLLSGQSP